MNLIQGVRSKMARCCAAWIVCLAALFLPGSGTAHAAPLPSVTFVGSQSNVGTSSDWSGPVGVAADRNGNLFVASYLGHYISQVNLATGAVSRINDFSVRYPQEIKIYGDTIYIASQGENLIKGYSLTTHALVRSLPMSGIFALAIDAAGNIYAGVDAGPSSQIYVFLAGNSAALLVKGSGLTSMTGLAVDSHGILFAADTNANIIYRFDPANSYAETTVPITVTSPRGMVFDANDDLYLTAAGTNGMNNGSVYRYAAGNYNTASGVLLAQGLNYNEEVTIASNGDQYVTSFMGNSVIRISPQVNFGTLVPVGSSATQTLVYSITAGTNLSRATASSTDSSIGAFNATAATCTAGLYSSNTVCNITIQYRPSQPAPAHGMLQIFDSSNTLVNTIYASGVGVAPQLAFAPSFTVAPAGVGTMYGIAPLPNQRAAVTSNTALYIGRLGSTPTLISQGLQNPREIAVDAQNNIFIADTDNNRIVTVPGDGTPATPTLFSTSTARFTGIAVDGAGSVYYADASNNQIIRRDWVDKAYGPEIVVATGIADLGTIAVDNARNLYVLSGSSVERFALQNGAYSAPTVLASSLSNPGGITLDGGGNIYISDAGSARLVQIPYTGGSYGTATTLLDNLSGVQQALVQPNGDMYIVSSTTGMIFVVTRSSASLSFGPTTLNTTNTSGPLKVSVQNIGTSAMTFSALPAGNPYTASSSFTLNTGSTSCPVTTAFPLTFDAGATCVAAVDYTPQNITETTGTLTFNDDALNAPGTEQQVHLSGSVTIPTPTVTGISPSSGYVTGGDNVTVTGTNFTGTMGVFVGTQPVSFTVNSDTSITIVMPAVSTAQVLDINVATPTGRSANVAADQYTYIAQTPSLAFAAIGAHSYGDAAFTVSATSASTGAVTYSVVSGPATVSGNRVSITGAGKVMLQASQAAAGSYTSTTANISFTINQATPTITSAVTGNTTYGAPLGSQVTTTATLNGTTVPGTYTYTVTPAGGSAAPATAGTVLGAGSYIVTTTFTPTDTVNYQPVVTTTPLTIAAQPVSVNMTSNAGSVTPGQPVTFTINVTGTAGNVPNGSVVIMDGGVVIGTVPVVNGVASFTTLPLTSGTHLFTATYTGNGNYAGSAASGTGTASVSVAALDFTMTTTGSTYQTVIPGGSVSYSFALAPNYTNYPAAVSFAVTGLPAGATYTITPTTIAPNSGATTAVLTVKTASLAANNQSSPNVSGAASAALAMMLLPFATARRLRKAGKLGRVLMLAIFVGAGLLGMAGLTGCGSGNGFLGQSPRDYTVTVTATSGTVQHTSTVTLNLQ